MDGSATFAKGAEQGSFGHEMDNNNIIRILIIINKYNNINNRNNRFYGGTGGIWQKVHSRAALA